MKLDLNIYRHAAELVCETWLGGNGKRQYMGCCAAIVEACRPEKINPYSYLGPFRRYLAPEFHSSGYWFGPESGWHVVPKKAEIKYRHQALEFMILIAKDLNKGAKKCTVE